MATDAVTAGLDLASQVTKAALQLQAERNTAAELAKEQSRQLQRVKDQINRLIADVDSAHKDDDDTKMQAALDELRRIAAA
jgi:predicted transglutaminase-like cysteine proteinase